MRTADKPWELPAIPAAKETACADRGGRSDSIVPFRRGPGLPCRLSDASEWTLRLTQTCGPHPADPRPALCRIAGLPGERTSQARGAWAAKRGIYGPFIPDHDHQMTTTPRPTVPPGPCQPSPRFPPAGVFPQENTFSSEKTPRRSLPPSRPYQKEPSGDVRLVSLRGRVQVNDTSSTWKINALESCLVVRKVRAALPRTRTPGPVGRRARWPSRVAPRNPGRDGRVKVPQTRKTAHGWVLLSADASPRLLSKAHRITHSFALLRSHGAGSRQPPASASKGSWDARELEG